VTGVVPDFLWNDRWWDVDVLKECHRGAKTAILDIEAKVAGAVVGVRNGAVDGCFVVEHGDGWGAGVAWAVEVVAGGCQANWMCFGPLEVDVTDEVCMGDFATPGDLGQFDEESCAGALDLGGGWASHAKTIGEESAPFVGKATFPDAGVWTEGSLAFRMWMEWWSERQHAAGWLQFGQRGWMHDGWDSWGVNSLDGVGHG
jgi:hypothetical protein